MEMINETVKNLRIKLDRREIGARELCAAYLAQIRDLNPALQALTAVFETNALTHAEQSQKLIDKGGANPLIGIPYAVSDNIMTAGKITTCASKMLANFTPPYDGAVIEALKAAHSPLIGKTALKEFSIGGTFQSGAAVSSGFIPFSIDSDTGGALRHSAAYNGMTGLRPTYGRVSRHGLAAHASSLDQIGAIAKTAEDCAIVLNTIAGKDPRDMMTFATDEDFTASIGKGIKGLTIALPKQFYGEDIDSDVKSAVRLAAEKLQAEGATLIEPETTMTDYATAVYFILASAEASSNLSRYDGVTFGERGQGATFFEQITDSRSKNFGDEVKRRIMFGNFVLSNLDNNYTEFYEKALALRQKIRAEYDEIFNTADLILTPTLPSIHPENFMAGFCTIPPSLAGLPSITTSCGVTPLGIPIGMLLTGKRHAEKTVIQAADFYESL
ncbi:MAG: aspartyl/glutamyl-tRNA amidotransferase subunit A [Oscillospiraceae bacterium]|nr:aspartyl/glutamyl-tRNA amidotransferase subunit A [Oscillospiraceae bacterium]